MNVLCRPSYFRSLKNLSGKQLTEINTAIGRLPEAMGKPHIHSGLSIRKLRPAIFELRASIEIRVLFGIESGDVVLIFAGNHDEVRVWLKRHV